MTERTRVLIVDDHQMIAQGLEVLLAGHDDLEVVGLAHRVEDGKRLARSRHPHVIVLDHYLPDGTGVDATTDFKAVAPEAAVVILTSETDEDVLLRAFESGASGYLLKTRAASQLIDAVRHAAAGEALVSAGTLARILRRPLARTGRAAPSLTRRELAVLALMAEGLETEAIAQRLEVTVATARTYIQSTLRKFDAHSRLQAVVRAGQAGLLD